MYPFRVLYGHALPSLGIPASFHATSATARIDSRLPFDEQFQRLEVPLCRLHQMELMDGIGFVPIIMGLFGMAEILENAEKPFAETVLAKMSSLVPSRQDIRDSTGPIMRGTFIGFFLGLMPGMTGSACVVPLLHRREEGFQDPGEVRDRHDRRGSRAGDRQQRPRQRSATSLCSPWEFRARLRWRS